jgi:hypothetical protein
VILPGQGDGSALWPYSGCALPSVTFTDLNGDSPLQIVNTYASANNSGLPDLLATSGDSVNGYYLDYYVNASEPCTFFQDFTISTPTPDGTADWNLWTLATLHDGTGTGMFLWKPSTGALYLWRGVTAHDNGDGTGILSYSQYLISTDWQKGVTLSTLEAADLNGDGLPDLWAVTPDGIVRAFLIYHLSATGPAEIKAGKPQKLS